MSEGLVLASGSPRRRELLAQIGIKFGVEQPDVDESLLTGEEADGYVLRLSRLKAKAVAERTRSNPVIVAADTTVELAGNILGKPESKEDGMAMLSALSGQVHRVFTGVTIRKSSVERSICVCSSVRFRQLSAAEMDYYWETGEPADKAGGYGLQGIGAAFVEAIDGSYTNVIGLPLSETIVLLRSFGIECMGDRGSAVGKESFLVEGSRNG